MLHCIICVSCWKVPLILECRLEKKLTDVIRILYDIYTLNNTHAFCNRNMKQAFFS